MSEHVSPRRVVAALVVVLVAPLGAHVGFVLLPGVESYVVSTSSMSPTIDAGSVVYVVANDEYETGDIVTFTHGDAVVTHRIVDETPSGFVTKGDANEARDGATIPRSAVVGRVVASVPFYGHLLSFAGSSVGVVLFVGAPSLLLVGCELKRLLRDQ